jgi:hypothetical protein
MKDQMAAVATATKNQLLHFQTRLLLRSRRNLSP